jgi:flagellar M-ring protein FliF
VDPPYKIVAAPNGSEQKVPAPRDKAELDKIRAIVMRAVGFNAARGDEVEVVELAFDTSVVDRERVAAERVERTTFWWQTGKQGALVLGAVLLLVFGLRSIVAMLRRAPARGTRVDIREPALTEADVKAQLAAKAAAALNPAQIIKGREREELQNRVVTIARENPAQVAQLIRSWMVGKKA